MSRRPNPIVLGLGVVGWIGLVWLAVTTWTATPRTAGFDLELVLEAGRAVAAGESPYDPAMIEGSAPGATDLFYSYPPPVAQFFSLFAAVPSGVMLALLWVASAAGLYAVAWLIARRFAPEVAPSTIAVPAVAIAPLFLPYSIALLFGNLDALFPFAYGLVLLAAVAPVAAPAGPTGTRDRVAGGTALALATAVKVAPGVLGGWFVGRVGRGGEERRGALTVLLVAVLVGLAVLGLSLLFGGLELWRDYLPVAMAASQAELLDPRNAGPAAQIALAVGGDEQLVRALQLPITIAAVIATLAAGALVRDRLLGLTIAAVASLVVLPITWYHYPVALMPFGIAAMARVIAGRGGAPTGPLVGAAVVVGSLAIAWVPALWVAVGLLLAAVAASRSPSPATQSR
ncbi:MAG TPA: glycosyltransferase 87 family protein [Candidatus Limnocylindrales bacterium]|nr:glycosyltransferase 87 family protein [Candidatus Limnocylindrales bacterium]